MDRPDLNARGTLLRTGRNQDTQLGTAPLKELLDIIRLGLPGFEGPHAIQMDGSTERVSGHTLQGWLLQD